MLDKNSGILLHITSLPSKYGIGDFGAEAYDFVDFLFRSGQKVWQILPLNPVGYGESPYQAYSAFAGNPMLISIDKLLEDGLLTLEDVGEVPKFSKKRVDFVAVKTYKSKVLKIAYKNFINKSKPKDYEDFIYKSNFWLESYALFMALKDEYEQMPWNHWKPELAIREDETIMKYRQVLKEAIDYEKFIQYCFYTQWQGLKDYANQKGISIIGDLPLFVSYDSSDAWSNPHLFKLDKMGKPVTVAGVPPDYFSEKGQLWGNPHYRWNEMKKDGYAWWKERIRWNLQQVDILRLDHFRGFEAYWEVSGDAKDARKGKWTKGPGADFFEQMLKDFYTLPIIVEDLGIITEEVISLKEQFGFSGMRILQFVLEDTESKDFFLGDVREVVYTGTHDNNTMLGWYRKASKEIKENIEELFGIKETMTDEEIVWSFIELLYGIKSHMVIIPLQDVICLGEEGRMNTPGTVGNNWCWRFENGDVTRKQEERLIELVEKKLQIP
jgi:4-alpha-glucanotransferase